MILKGKKEKNKKVNKKTLDKRNYFFFALIGVILIGVLMILQTRFKEYFRLNNDGFAVVSNTVTEYLSINPNEEDVEALVEMQSFEALEYLYTQGGKYFLGDKKKVEVDTSYPVYMNQGAVLQLLENTGVLYDENYDKEETYQGLYIEGGYAYNLDGEKADASKYLFLGMNNGNFVNFETISYDLKNEEFDINENSLVHFESDYFSYYEYEKGELVYKYCISVNDTFKLSVGEKQYTYDELLKLLGLRSEYPEFEGLDKDDEEEEPITEEDIEVDDDTEPAAEVEIKKPKPEAATPPSAPTPSSGKENSNSSPGVRPDDIVRPGSGSTDTEEREEEVEDYEQPQVTINDVTANVYRLFVDATIYDPASRIDATKFVRFEVYEVDADGNEQLAMRSFRRGEGRDTTVLGGGAIKPETTYRVKGNYTYYDEYNEEQYVDLGTFEVKTGSFDDLTEITLTHEQGTSYHNRIEVVNFGFDEALSDTELVYGVNPHGGIKFVVKNKATGEEVTARTLTASEVSSFKLNKGVILSSLSTLKAKTEYQYEFEAEDYFGNKITLVNSVGYAMTSNHSPNATIVEEVNEIGRIGLSVSIEDIDAAAVPSLSETDAADACDIYLILTKEDPARYDFNSFEEMEEAGVIVAYKKLDDTQYSYDATNGLVAEDVYVEFTGLRLGEKFFASVYGDYDLSNRMGPQYFENIGQMSFKSTDLNSLGKIYVTADFDSANLTYKSLPMSFHLNKESTNDQLEGLITGMKIEVVRDSGVGDDAKIDATFEFDENTLAADEVTKVLDMFKDTAVSYLADNLQSMTEYQLKATIYARYQDEEYEITPQLSNYAFKTLRKPAEVTVQDLLFAAGTLIFDVKVADPDGTIIGVSGDKVVVQLYTAAGEFVKTVRVQKDLEDWQTVTFNNLDPTQKYELRFIAVEYNEGYTNATYISNKLLKTVNVDKSMSLDGTIKLQEINAIEDDSEHYEAIVKATLNDPDHYLTRNDAIPYYIKVEKDGELVEDTAFDLSGENESTVYEKRHNYIVDKGEHTYKLTMYVIVSGREVELDTLTFTTETTVKGFSTAYEMIQLLKSDSDGKYVATNSFVLNSNSWNFKDVVDPGDVESMSEDEIEALGTGLSGANIVSIYNGQIDFQGFTLTHNYYADAQRMFTNIGSKGVIENLVYSVKNLNETRVHDDAMLCYRNFGTIRDIYVKYRGGYVLANEYYGILARVNSSTGVIENFVIENTPDEGFAGLSAYRYAGLVTYDNYGIIRYGYVYGDNIITTNIEASLTREIGGIAGANRTLGSIYSVYSLLNVDETSMRPSPNHDYTYGNYYGAVCGQSWGKLSNIYSTADSFVVESKNSGTLGYQFSPIVGGRNNATNSNVYYYSEKEYQYAVSKTKSYSVDLNELYDVTWQNAMLTDSFDTSLVEVGFYPHVKLSSDLPEQEYIPLPTRIMQQPVEISRATVLEYGTLEDGTDCATVEFVFTNRDGLDIVGLDISDIDVELDLQTAKYEDGYTTILGVVSNPRTFYSEYEIQSIKYYRNSKLTANAVSYILKADFYRKVYTTDDWYTYMVDRKNSEEFENVRLEADLDFEGIAADDIMVKQAFGRILDGNGHTISNIDLQYGFNANNNTTLRRLFKGDVTYSGTVKNLFVDNYRAGGKYENTTKGKTYVSRAAAVFGTVYGLIENVHASDVEITTYDYAAGLIAYLGASGEVRDCSVTNLTLNYNDPDDVNADSFIGGLVGRANEARITHCYTQGIKITVDETKSTYGIGGVVGYANNSVVDTAYAEGEIVSRAQKVGGVVGHYYCTSAAVACMKNMYAKVDIICYTDVAGGLVGQTNITQDRISATNNFSGLGLGNVYLANLDSVNCSQTIGTNLGKNATFYGTEEQLINGIAGVGYEGKEDSVRGLLSYDDLMNDAQKSYFDVVGFENVYSIDGASEGYLPKMYYTDRSKGLLPNQTDLLLDELKDIDIEVTNVIHNDVDRLVTVELRNPNNYKITSINIRNLEYHFIDMAAGRENYGDEVDIDVATDYDRGYTRIYLQYEEEFNQEYFLDSYVMDNITFCAVKDSGLDSSLTANDITTDLRSIPIYSRINVMLCYDIKNAEAWNTIPGRENAGHIYENYRLTGDLNFAYVDPATNLKLGRLISDNGERTISNVDISGADMHFISRLNSGIKGVNFVDCNVKSTTVGCIGLVGVSNGTIIDCDFENITITPQTNNTDEVAIIGHSNGGTFKNVTLENVTVNAKKSSIDYVGGFLGKVQDGSNFENVAAHNISVTGTGNYVGGVAGATEISNVTDIDLSDIVVNGKGNYTGGFIGQFGYNVNSNTRVVTNIRITGTPTYDEDGRVIASTTKIEGNNYVGGISGQTNEKVGSSYQASKPSPNIYVDGIVVSGLQRLGGAFGATYTNMYHLTVQNALITTRDDLFKATSSYVSAGGVIGEISWSPTRALLAENVVVDVTNTSHVGGLVGLYHYASMQHCYVVNCYINADTASAFTDSVSNVGGAIGLYENAMYYNGVINTTVNAPNHSNVGGVVGRLSQSLANNHYVGNSFYIADYDEEMETEYFLNAVNRYTAAAVSDYYVKGFTNVGGIVGKQNSGYIKESYSNANVIAADYQIAGGIVGMYCNEYVTSISNGKTYYTYAVTGMYRNYFAGNVTAKNGYAGGAIGRTGLLYKGLGTDENGVVSLTGYNGNRIKGVNANSNEVDKTYGNIVFADTIVGGKGKTGAFAADDTQFVFIGRDNRIWDKTIINDGTGDTYAAAITKADGTYAYNYWNTDNTASTSYPVKLKEIQVFESIDLDGSQYVDTAKKHNRAAVFYRTIGWSLTWTNTASKDYAGRDTIWRVSVGDIDNGSGGTRGMKNQYESTGSDTGTYLPQMREATNRMYKNDNLIMMQESISRLPLPRDKNDARTLTLTSGYSMRNVETTYGMVYASDIDKINVEFSADLVNEGYYVLKVGDTVIAKEVITDRVTTFSYAFNENITFEYGYLKDNTLPEDTILNGSNFDELESVLLGVNDIKTDIMVYHNDYYYISDKGLVSTAGTWNGDFVTIMNGKALDSDGNIWNVESKSKEGSVTRTEKLDDVEPLWTFKYGSIDIATYAKYSYIESEYSAIERDAQLFIVNDQLYTVDGSLETRKTDILLYNLNGEMYQTVLGNDGIMVDMMQDDWNIPDEVKNQAIVRMSNTLNASVPYVLIEYNNGGIIGYNYATGEILFDNSIETKVSLLQYAQSFFSGESTSQYANISNTYSANADLSERIHSSDDLEKIVGNSSGELVKDNSTGENTSSAVGEQALANSSNAQAGDGVQGSSEALNGQGSNEENFEGVKDDIEGTFVGTEETEPEDATKSDNDSDYASSSGNNSSDDISSNDENSNEESSNDEKDADKTENEVENKETEESDKSEATETEETTESEADAENNENNENADENVNPNPGNSNSSSEKEKIGAGEYMTVYNNETGVYEIVSIAEYLTEDAYISENHKLGIKDLSQQVSSGYAVSKVDVNQERGIVMYIVPILIIFGIAGAIVIYVKRKERKA